MHIFEIKLSFCLNVSVNKQSEEQYSLISLLYTYISYQLSQHNTQQQQQKKKIWQLVF